MDLESDDVDEEDDADLKGLNFDDLLENVDLEDFSDEEEGKTVIDWKTSWKGKKA